MLLLLCTRALLVLFCYWFDRGSRQVKRELVDQVMEDYDISLCQRIGRLVVIIFIVCFNGTMKVTNFLLHLF